jgi:uroporphyrinogen decarboxylase
MADCGADVIGLDWTMSLARARSILVSKNKPLALQGNLDPLALFANPEQITHEASTILDSLANAPALRPQLHPLDGHIFNLGHGISQFTNPDSVTVLAKTVIEHSERLRKAK